MHVSYTVGNNGLGFELGTALHQELHKSVHNDILIRHVTIQHLRQHFTNK